jgi:ABC-type enterochelin transport system substrate-binding protein
MSREKEMFDRFAKEVASEIIAKENDPEYVMVLDRRSVIDKLSTIMGKNYPDTASLFDQKVNSYIKTLKNRL